MAWLWEHSEGWRRLVRYTRRSPLHTAGFSVAALGAAAALGATAQAGTTRDEAGGELETRLRKRASGDAKVLVAANRARLEVLLDEARRASSGDGADAEARYAASLRGVSLGTHSAGTTAGATAIKKGGGVGGGG